MIYFRRPGVPCCALGWDQCLCVTYVMALDLKVEGGGWRAEGGGRRVEGGGRRVEGGGWRAEG